jgi:hypothetical protein
MMIKYLIVIYRYHLHRQLSKEIVQIDQSIKSYKPPKNNTATIVNGRCSGP